MKRKNHLKRLNTPRTWNLLRKAAAFVTRPFPGEGSLMLGLPLAYCITALDKAKTTKEAKTMLHEGKVLVNGRVIKEPKFLVGIFSVVSFPEVKESYRLTLSPKGRLNMIHVDEKESGLKLCKIKGKTAVKGKIQLNLNDGANLLIDKNGYAVGDTLLITFNPFAIKEVFKFTKGNSLFMVGGKHIGELGVIEKIEGKTITYKKKDGSLQETNKRHAFVIGKEKSAIMVQ
jgi:small subunit ribosomal protein S4e